MKPTIIAIILSISASLFAQDYEAPVWANYDKNSFYLNYQITIKNGLQGISDENGNIIFHPNFKMIRADTNDRFVFRLNSKKLVGLIDIDSNVIIPEIYRVLDTDNHKNLLAETKYKSGILSFEGDTLYNFITTGFRRYNITMYPRNIIIKEKGKYVFYNSSLKRAFEKSYKDFQLLTYAPWFPYPIDYAKRPARYAVKEGNKWFVINEDGQILNNEKYDKVLWEFSDVIFVENERRSGAIDTTGKKLFDCDYKELKPGQGNLVTGYSSFFALKNKKWGLLSRNGEQLQPAIYNSLESLGKGSTLCLGHLNDHNNIIIIDTNGKALNIEPYSMVTQLSGTNRFKVCKIVNGACLLGLIDGDGKWVLPIEFDSIKFENDKFIAFKNGAEFQYDLFGNCLNCHSFLKSSKNQ